jgi:hypothetical protein
MAAFIFVPPLMFRRHSEDRLWRLEERMFAAALFPAGPVLYDGYVTYVVLHGSPDRSSEQAVDTVAAAARIAISFAREQRRDVRVRLPDGSTLPFDDFQDAVFRGELKDEPGLK